MSRSMYENVKQNNSSWTNKLPNVKKVCSDSPRCSSSPRDDRTIFEQHYHTSHLFSTALCVFRYFTSIYEVSGARSIPYCTAARCCVIDAYRFRASFCNIHKEVMCFNKIATFGRSIVQTFLFVQVPESFMTRNMA